GLGRFAVPVSHGARSDALVGFGTAADTDPAPCSVERRRARAVSVAAPSLSRVQVASPVIVGKARYFSGGIRCGGKAPSGGPETISKPWWRETMMRSRPGPAL